MTTYNYFIGIDIGKTTNAVCVLDAMENRRLELSIPNSRAGMESLLKQLNKLPDFSLETTLFYMEHTARAAPRDILPTDAQLFLSHWR